MGYRRRNYALTIFGVLFILLGFFIPFDSSGMDKIALYSLGIIFMFFGIVLEFFRTRQEREYKKVKKS